MNSSAAPGPLRPRVRFTGVTRLPSVASIVASAILGLILVLSFVLPALTGYSPDQFVGAPYQAPSVAHPFGTDMYGRDVMVRTFAAAQIDYLVPLLVVAISVIVGNILGVAATLSGGFWEWLLLRITDVIIAFPFLILILVLVVVFGQDAGIPFVPPGTMPIIVAASLTGWAYYARLARSQTLYLRKMDYVTAARLMGYSTGRILLRHLAPKVMGASVSYAIGDVLVVMGLIASLSLFGAGVAPPTAEWGQMMFESRSVMRQYWWNTIFPLLFIIISAVSLADIAERAVTKLEGRVQ